VAFGVMRERLGLMETGIFLATAHPAKFADSMESILGSRIPLPPALVQAQARPLQVEDLGKDLEALKAALG
jgi:threonine synthase